MVDRQRHIGRHRLPDRLAVVPRLGTGEQFEILLHSVGDLEQDVASLGRRSIAPGLERRMCRIERRFDVCLVRTGDLCKRPCRRPARYIQNIRRFPVRPIRRR